jgi:N-methylhydantoinase A
MKTILGVDTGGTFTDFVLYRKGQLSTHKVLSTPHAPEQAILQGLADMGLQSTSPDSLYIVHGSTVATNAVLEGKGVSCVFITNHGLRDMLTIGRQTRRELYNLQPEPPPVPVAREFCLEIGGRLAADGSEVEALNPAELEELVKTIEALAPEAVAINLLFSYLDPQFEIAIENALNQSGGSKEVACRLLGYKNRTALYEKIRKLDLNDWIDEKQRLVNIKNRAAKTPKENEDADE